MTVRIKKYSQSLFKLFLPNDKSTYHTLEQFQDGFAGAKSE
jgi:hypothetical protein